MASKAIATTETTDVADLNGGLLAVIDRAVRDPSVDVDKMERLLAMQERIFARSAEQTFNEALLAAQAEIQPVVKNKLNPDTKSRYANLEAVANSVDPIMRRHGFTQSFGTADCPLEGHYRVTCLMSHTGGHKREYQADVPIDNTGPKGSQNKTMTHGFGSALSYGRRYLKLLIADVATTDDDGNGAGQVQQGISADQCAELRRMIAQAGVTEESFCDYTNCGTLPELPAKDFERAKGVLSQRIRAAGGK